jgi:RimJ/RimL family protein N-acetyltransferase
MNRPAIIHTERLDLVAGTVPLLRAAVQDLALLARLLQAQVPAAWPPDLIDNEVLSFTAARLAAGAEQAGWWSWYFVHRGAAAGKRVLVGMGGFKGPPAADGSVEIGYTIAAPFRRRGHASEAVAGLLGWAFAHPGVQRVQAQTLPHLQASLRVLEQAGFVRSSAPAQPGVLLFVLPREAYLSR